MNLWLTCSQVRFNRRIGGELSPEMIAAILEKLWRFLQRCFHIKKKRGGKMSEQFISLHFTLKHIFKWKGTYVCNSNKLLHKSCSLPRILLTKNCGVHPISNLRGEENVSKHGKKILANLNFEIRNKKKRRIDTIPYSSSEWHQWYDLYALPPSVLGTAVDTQLP